MPTAWIWIPIVAILVGAFKEWLRFNAQHRRLGASTHELEREVSELREQMETLTEQNRKLVRRVQNLETLATSRLWDRVDEIVPPKVSIEPDPDDEEDARRVAEIARRLSV